MKKFLLVISSLIITIGLCACGGAGGLFSSATPTPVPVVSPMDIITAADVTEIAGYEPVLSGDIKDENNAKTAVYVSNPIGKQDSVTVKIVQFNDGFTKDDVWKQYDGGRIKRQSAELVGGLGQDAYIAFPSIHIYDRGCEIVVSAGSGSNDSQKELLKRMGERAVMNFEKIITTDTEDKSSSGAIKQE